MFTRYDIVEGYYWFLTHTYMGQGDKRYARLCRIQAYFSPGCNQTGPEVGTSAEIVYNALMGK
jgi:hypothetical protein